MTKPRHPRTLVASILALIAVAVPCTAWYFAGQRQVERQAESDRSQMETKGYKTAFKLAEDLSLELETLADAESRRSIFHYQNLYHDPQGAAEGVMVLPSPLARGPEDPLIEAYFQVDGEGTLSLPTLNDAFPELGLEGAEDSQCELLWKLQDVALFCHLEAARPAAGSRWTDLGDLEEEPAGYDFDLRRIEIDSSAWRQHLQANDVWARLKVRRGRRDSRRRHLGQAAGESRPGVRGGRDGDAGGPPIPLAHAAHGRRSGAGGAAPRDDARR